MAAAAVEASEPTGPRDKESGPCGVAVATGRKDSKPLIRWSLTAGAGTTYLIGSNSGMQGWEVGTNAEANVGRCSDVGTRAGRPAEAFFGHVCTNIGRPIRAKFRCQI